MSGTNNLTTARLKSVMKVVIIIYFLNIYIIPLNPLSVSPSVRPSGKDTIGPEGP